MLWLKRNLFRTWWDGVLTVVFGALSVWVIWSLAEFVLVTGRWEIIEVNLKLLLVGRFPEELLWLVEASIMAIAFWLAAALGGARNPEATPVRWGARIWDAIRRFGLVIALGITLVMLGGLEASGLLMTGIITALVIGRVLNAPS